VGHEGANDSITSGRDIAWLQDVPEVNAWGSWDVVYRDVFVLDREGNVEGVLNLTENSLAEPQVKLTLTTLVDDALAR